MYLDAAFFARPSVEVAPQLVGAVLERKFADGRLLAARIVEVEAYLPEGDAGAHGARGFTHARRALFDKPGTLYIHPMRAYVGMDIVTDAEGVAGSVLIRAAEPLEGVEMMRRLAEREDVHKLASGPGKLCRALAINTSFYGLNVTDAACPLRVRAGEPADVMRGPRVGLNKATDLPLRFFVPGSRFVSR